jgi:hypothetical protein
MDDINAKNMQRMIESQYKIMEAAQMKRAKAESKQIN